MDRRRVQDKTSIGETIQPPIEIAGSRRVRLADSGDEAVPGTETDRVVEQLPIVAIGPVAIRAFAQEVEVEVGRFGLCCGGPYATRRAWREYP
jgi:hypothetical protein